MLTLAQTVVVVEPVGIGSLLLPVILAAAAVFIASSVIWMVLPYHKADIQFMKQEEAFKDAISPLGIEPGLYMYPNCEDSKDARSESYQERWNKGPWGVITVFPGKPNFPMNLAKCFVSYLVISLMVAYLTSLAHGTGADYMDVFRVAATASVLGYCMGSLAGDAFLGKPSRFIMTSFFDGIVFAMITAGVLAAMWPEGSAPLSVTP